MNRVTAILIAMLACCLSQPAAAAKVSIRWTLPTQNTDGSALTDLAASRVEWGACRSGAMDAVQSSVLLPTPAVIASIYPTGLNPVCVRVFARNAVGHESAPSTVLQITLPGPLSKPVTIGQPVVLPSH